MLNLAAGPTRRTRRRSELKLPPHCLPPRDHAKECPSRSQQSINPAEHVKLSAKHVSQGGHGRKNLLNSVMSGHSSAW